ncbi:MAG: UDP-N-acetylmuramate dehydrogenase [Oleiphilaceae bacterium]|nr:UDP-N-acetylmuramate dehydrogenase [Oleiphilaceae bacterium]
MQLHHHVDLTPANTMALACVAERVYELDNEQDLNQCFQQGVLRESPLVLGGGSNVLLPPRLNRPVLRYRGHSVKYYCAGEQVEVVAEAGKDWDTLVAETVQKGLSGLENLSLIPGSVGAAPVQNIGAYGVEMANVMPWLEAFDLQQGQVRRFSNKQCAFAYRDSLFKRQPGRYLITRVAFLLWRGEPFTLSYAGLEELAEQPDLSPSMIREKVIELRSNKLPDPRHIPNSGSFFKNPVVTEAQFEKLKQRFPTIVSYPLENRQYKVAAGWLIDQLGFKGYALGAFSVHDKQALVLTHQGGKESRDRLLQLADVIKGRVLDTYGITLEIEPDVVSQ